ncbi:MAG: hypothetical protein NTY08_08875 [Proteobacteria bacterium]|nr:hypothetical protein [Pseudomonadota bacterium]
MNQGLKRMLSRISDSPKSTLIDRYLVLVSELPTDIEKSDHVLALAESLVDKSPNNALRIARMVHNAEPGNLRAFDVLIAAFESLGKIAKAGILRLEKEKVEKLGEPQNITEIISVDSIAPPPPLTAGDEDPREDGTSIYNLASELAALAGEDSEAGVQAEIFFGESLAAPGGRAELDLTPPSPNAKSRLGESPREEAPPTPKNHLEAKAATSRQPIPWKKNDELSALESDQSPLRNQDPPPLTTTADPDSAALDWRAADLEAYATPLIDGAPSLPLLDLKHPSDSDLARHRPKRPRQKGQLIEVLGPNASLPQVPMLPSQFWDPLRAQVAGASWDAPLAKHKQRRDSILANLDAPKVPPLTVPASLVQAIQDNFQAQVASAPDVALLQTWDVMQALWGDRPDAVCAKLLTDLNLARATKGFWGMYLDALLARGAGRKVLIEVATVIAKEHQLAWARIAWQRLPTAWRSLGVRGFVWQEDDGIDALLQRLAKRPQITMRSLLLR